MSQPFQTKGCLTGSCASCRLCLAPIHPVEERPIMTKQTHTVATDALATLGTIIDETAGRDAIHLAVEPVVAVEKLFPGQHVGFVDGGVGTKGAPIGIVDPFITGFVAPGQHFWLVVYPRTITSLRHVWEHPAFTAAEDQPKASENTSEQWIRDWAAGIPLAYDTVMEGAREWVASQRSGGWGEYLNFGGLLEGESVPDAFWPHYEAVTGETVDENHRGSFFTCSC